MFPSPKADTPTPSHRAMRHHRSLFVSDLHLGARGCKAERFLTFLQHNSADTIYLVGDILDVWHSSKPHWSAAHDAIVETLLNRAEDGVRLVYLPGNHDHQMHSHYGTYFDRIEVAEQAFHTAADGRRYLVLHGDCCDARMLRWHIVTRIGSRLDNALRLVDAGLKRLRGRDDTSLIEFALSCVNSLLSFGNRFEKRLIALARQHGQDGVICGHFHKAALHRDHGLIYANCGDWIDSFTALAEQADGRLVVLGATPEPAVSAAGQDDLDGAIAVGSW